MTDAKYGITKSLGKVDFEQALGKVTKALKGAGFGVLTEIDIQATLKKKLDVDFRKYRILGACNPSLAHEALRAELMIGLLLPCNVIVFEEDDGTVTVSAVNPAEMFQVVGRPDVAPLADKVDAKLRQAMDEL